MKRTVLFAMTIALGLSQAQAANPEAGKTLYASNCAQCHGPTAKGMASFPKLTGRDADYITARLETYRAGEKVGPNSLLMIPNARDLSDDDIANLSAFLSSNPN
ncbi:c-type cytochrome [Marinobacter sp. X15-166B]|uniref:c-type cytochrome n=1 Tax=Marinobacter sp. X15-166B TaxID=1897620 RepID=UPI00085C30DC|nr:c-type cytochrome [Marinobacter sp. X15-166B]OEY67505.1 cytochrome C [Marinobacter sp. X15-166B]